MRNTITLLISPAILAMIVGCSSSDERLAQFAEQSVQTQHQQNDALARQSEAVVHESHELAEAAQQLVSRDAQARQDLIQSQRQLHEELHQEQSGVDRQRDALDQERRAIAEQRQRDPIMAAAIERTGMLLACLAPLTLAAYVLVLMGRSHNQAPELEELLLGELTAGEPNFSPGQTGHGYAMGTTGSRLDLGTLGSNSLPLA
jgi:hypothetical protein